MIQKPLTCVGCPLYSPPYGKSWGFSRPDGTGRNGVMLVAEALGENEEEAGIALVGKAGHYLFQHLKRVGIDRDDFTLFNCIACRPPNNKLAKQPYEIDALNHCVPNLDAAITVARNTAKEHNKHFVIVTLGRIAFKRIMGFIDKSPIMHDDYLCYPFWSERYQAWVIAADHPSYLMRGNHHLVPLLQFAVSRALEIADDGLTLDSHQYLLDPPPAVFQKWIEDYLRVYDHDPLNTFLSYDIETPYKQGKDEEEVAREDDDDYSILRCSFAYRPNEAVSVPWRAEYIPLMEELFTSDGPMIGWNSQNYDLPRVRAQVAVNGDQIDGMLAWHVLNSSLRKGLGFVAPFYAQTSGVWKYMSSEAPAFYNAKDADIALRCFLGVRKNMKENDLWGVFQRHVVELNRVFDYMSKKGVQRDEVMRADAEVKLATLLAAVEEKMEAAVPQDALRASPKNGYTKEPKSIEGMVKRTFKVVEKACPKCGVLKPRKVDFDLCGTTKDMLIPVESNLERWCKLVPFKVSKLGMLNYQHELKHQAIINRKENKITFDENAITRLMKKYPNDKLYPTILEHRGHQKLLSTYIGVTDSSGRTRGGMPIGRDGRIHTLFTCNPSTLRSASQNPNLQNLPRSTKVKDDLGNIIRNLIVASDGHIFTARDYSGIEAVLVGYFALSPRYIRLSKIDVHSFYTAYGLHQLDGRISSNDLPDFNWPDARLIPHLAAIKKEFSQDRNSLYKHLVHGANFMQGAKGAAEKIFSETGIEYPVAQVGKVMGVYFELFPEIRKWHKNVLLQADKDGFLRNPFGYIHRFSKVYEYEKIGGEWKKEPGPQANQVIAFLPQSSAAGIIKEAMLRLYFNRFEEAGQYLRLLVHDELFSEVPVELVEAVDKVMMEEMERPIMSLPLPKSYGMGDHLVILTEAKKGERWGGMK